MTRPRDTRSPAGTRARDEDGATRASRARVIQASRPDRCLECGCELQRGDWIRYYPGQGSYCYGRHGQYETPREEQDTPPPRSRQERPRQRQQRQRQPRYAQGSRDDVYRTEPYHDSQERGERPHQRQQEPPRGRQEPEDRGREASDRMAVELEQRTRWRQLLSSADLQELVDLADGALERLSALRSCLELSQMTRANEEGGQEPVGRRSPHEVPQQDEELPIEREEVSSGSSNRGGLPVVRGADVD